MTALRIDIKDLLSRIDHAVLKPWHSGKELDEAVAEAEELGLRGIIVSPPLLPRLVKSYSGGVRGVVIGFPYGYSPIEAKVKELERALADDPDEVDAVINYQQLILGNTKYVRNEVEALVELCHDVGVRIKVIVEAPALERDLLVEAVRIAAEAGADYVKTSTGLGPRKTIPEDVVVIDKVLRRLNVRSRIGIKAAGGIRSAMQAAAMIQAGADIIGTSTPREILSTYQRMLE